LIFNIILSYTILLIILLLSVALVTLIEQKMLALIQLRYGPDTVGYEGILQPFADAVKLLSKESVELRRLRSKVYWLSPVVSMVLRLVM
jgi:NADH:ubiquinone oxidoreductase subunit H